MWESTLSVHLSRGNELVVLQPGESYIKDGKNIVEIGGVKAEISSKERISNFGVFDKSKIRVGEKTAPIPEPILSGF